MHIALTKETSSKLGPNVLVINRPVGDTCPLECPLHPMSTGPLRNKCYMVRIEGLRPQMRRAAQQNRTPDVRELTYAFLRASQQDLLVRLHPGGDFYDFLCGDLDWPYIAAICDALRALQECGYRLPRILAYTHCIDSRLVAAFAPFAPRFQLFASVHDDLGIQRAKVAGFTRFALTMPDVLHGWEGGAWEDRHGQRWLVCPEQRFKIEDCASCGYCWRPDRGNVAFLEHSQPRSKQLAIQAQRQRKGDTACADGFERHLWNGTGRCARCDLPLQARGRAIQP